MMKHAALVHRFENNDGKLEVMLNYRGEGGSPSTISGHWENWDGKTYHNSGTLVEIKPGVALLDVNKQHVDELAHRTWGIDDKEAEKIILFAIEELVPPFHCIHSGRKNEPLALDRPVGP